MAKSLWNLDHLCNKVHFSSCCFPGRCIESSFNVWKTTTRSTSIVLPYLLFHVCWIRIGIWIIFSRSRNIWPHGQSCGTTLEIQSILNLYCKSIKAIRSNESKTYFPKCFTKLERSIDSDYGKALCWIINKSRRNRKGKRNSWIYKSVQWSKRRYRLIMGRLVEIRSIIRK